ncbi:MAG TPA: NADH-quinone oxidoreductase subunit H [Candidatus Eisenbacteria bacterium]|nr:NADH-quinone oxidoreductase subunit H [Candidatus Eisenbacteria bacterium]
MSAVAALILLLALAPLLPAVAAKTVALVSGRRGAPLLQPYRDLRRLLGKHTVRGTTAGWLFRAAPVAWPLTAAAAVALLPLDGRAALARFPGDLVVFAGLLALGRFALTLAALDTGSSFEGMGASRELLIGALAEPVLFTGLFTLALATGGGSLSALLGPPLAAAWPAAAAALVMVALSVGMLLLAEAARGPIDDPATHLELTMIHEVMVLDHSGPELALLHYGSALRFAVFAAVLTDLLWPAAGPGGWAATARLPLGLAAVGVLVGLVESSMARLRLTRIPQYLVSAGVLASLGALLLLRP